MSPVPKTRSAKLMLLGDIGVGKTSLARRLVFDRFDGEYKTTIGVDVLTYDIKLSEACRNETMRLVLWDTDGDFGQAIFSTMYVAGAAGAIVVADATRPASFERMSGLLRIFKERFPGRPVKAIINKIDLIDPARDLPPIGELHGADRTLSSALTGEGVVEAFRSIAETIWRRAA